MRKSVYLLFCFCFASLSAFASWGRFTIKFNDNHTDDTISRSCYNLIVSKGTVNDEGIAKIYISIKNNDPTYSIYLFDKTYSKKELRKYYRIVVNNKECEQVLETNYCKFISNVHCVPPFQLIPIGQLQIHEGEEMEIVIPVFMAKKKNSISNKMRIAEWDLLELSISLEEKNDPDYINISNECDKLLKEIAQQQFCRHPLHQPSLEQQEEPYQTAIENLRQQIESKLLNMRANSKSFRQYMSLKDRLDKIDFANYEVENCNDPSKHLKKGSGSGSSSGSGDIHPHCRYCDMTLEQIWAHLDNLYQKVDNNITDKKTAVNEVNQILKCCKNSSKHANEWNSGKSKYRKGIENLCNKIKNY